MLAPTPGRHNSDGILGFAADTKFSVDRGFFDAPFSVTITTDTPGATIRYTLDGSAPTATTGNVYSAPLTISSTTILRAAAFRTGYQPGNIDTQTYIFVSDVISQPTMSTIITNDPVWGPQLRAALLAIPTVSLVTNAALVSGSETKTSMELINPDGSKGFQIDAGAELFGNVSLIALPKKSIRVSFKGIYGATKLNFDVFGNGATQEFDELLLRGESFDSAFYTNGTDGSYLRSTLTSDLQAGMGDLAPHERFVHLYINGEYRGEYSLMERTDAPFMASYMGGSKEDYDSIHADNPVTRSARRLDRLERHGRGDLLRQLSIGPTIYGRDELRRLHAAGILRREHLGLGAYRELDGRSKTRNRRRLHLLRPGCRHEPARTGPAGVRQPDRRTRRKHGRLGRSRRYVERHDAVSRIQSRCWPTARKSSSSTTASLRPPRHRPFSTASPRI